VGLGFGGEDVAFLRVKSHPPFGGPFFQALEIFLKGEVILKGVDHSVE
jgi:hypothetical protein